MPGVFSLIHLAFSSLNDGKVYFDHVLCLIVIVFALKPEPLIEETFEKRPVKKAKKIEYEQVFEVRPSLDGGQQGKSPLPYYMDDEGDIANEFYEEVNNKFVKVSSSKLKQI